MNCAAPLYLQFWYYHFWKKGFVKYSSGIVVVGVVVGVRPGVSQKSYIFIKKRLKTIGIRGRAWIGCVDTRPKQIGCRDWLNV